MSLPIERIRELLAPAYTVDRELGRGGMATVYLAQDSRHERVVALKVLHRELAVSLGPDRFLREIKVAARLNHPHILPLFDSGEVQGLLYYVMPYVEGESLRERLDRQQQLPVDEAVHYARSIASALDYAHRQNVVHRDIKPENVMLYEGEPMVMDFGIAKAVSAAGAHGVSLTSTGMMVGTPAYVSPEQAAGETNLDGRSDQYSLACVLYEMLAGERPFNGPTAQAILSRRFTEIPKRIREMRSGVPENIDRALFKALSTDLADRYKTSALFAQALNSSSLVTPTETETVPHLAVSAAKSVAVLPFANMSADVDNEYFADGMAEEIINALSKIQSLRVASRTSSFAFKGKNEDIGEIGRKLKVSTVLEGSVRRMGKRLRINAELVNVADGYHLWSERYDRELEDVFAIQDDISHAIVTSLRAILTEGEKKAIEKARTTNVQAYDYYLRGRQYVHEWRRKSVENALKMFKRAIEIDPDYALAYTGVADSCSLLYTHWDPSRANVQQADIASRKALELDPGLAEAHVARGIALSLTKEHAAADKEFETAMRLDPKLFEAAYFYGRALKSQGRFAEAAKMFERATVLRPEDYEAANFLAGALADLGDKANGEVARNRALKLIEERVELNPDDARATNLGAAILAKSGDRVRTIEYIRRSLEIDPDDANMLYNIACAYSQLGMSAEALASLERAVDNGYADVEWMQNDSDFESIRGTPGFQAIVRGLSGDKPVAGSDEGVSRRM